MNTESLSPLRYVTSVMRRTMPLSAIAAHHIEQRAPELFFLLDRLFPSDNGIAPVSISYPFPSTLVRFYDRRHRSRLGTDQPQSVQPSISYSTP